MSTVLLGRPARAELADDRDTEVVSDRFLFVKLRTLSVYMGFTGFYLF